MNPQMRLFDPPVVLFSAGQGCGDRDTCIDFTENYLEWGRAGVGRYLVFMVIQGFVFLALTLLLEYRVIQRLCSCLSCFSRRGR